MLKERDVKVDEETDAFAAEFHVGEKLRLVYRKDSIDGLELDNDSIGNQNIDSITGAQIHALVDDWKFHFALKLYPP